MVEKNEKEEGWREKGKRRRRSIAKEKEEKGGVVLSGCNGKRVRKR